MMRDSPTRPRGLAATSEDAPPLVREKTWMGCLACLLSAGFVAAVVVAVGAMAARLIGG